MENGLINKGMTQLIAEVSNSHEGSFSAIKEITRHISETGVKIIKYQKYYAEELCVYSHSKYKHFQKMEFDFKQWKELISLAKESGLSVYCDVFGEKSAKELISIGIDGYKLHSSDLANMPLIKLLASTKKPILLSCAGTTLIEIYEAIQQIGRCGNNDIILMHGFQGFPTAPEDANLNRIDYLSKTFNLPVGFSDHTDADSDYAYIIPLLSAVKGAKFIEKHVTLNRSKKGIDYHSALEPLELQKLKFYLETNIKTLGETLNVWPKDEQIYRKRMKKLLVAVKNLSKNHIIAENDISFKRCEIDDGIFSLNYADVLGKKVIRDIPKDAVIRNSDLENKIGILIAVRVNSQRLPKKALLEICGKKTIEHLIERAKLSKKTNFICLCTTTEPEDKIFGEMAKNYGIAWLRGSKDNVLERFIEAIKRDKLDVVVRVTGDDILLDPVHLDKTVDYLLQTNAEYSHNKKLPSGTECEVFLASTLRKIYTYAQDATQTEYLTYYVNDNQFNKNELSVEEKYIRDYRLTLDTSQDYTFIKSILENIYSSHKPYTLDDLLSYINQHPELLKINDKLPSDESASLKINTKLNFV